MPNTEDRLLGQYASLVRRLALQLAARLPSNIELDDLIQAGMMGLLDAIRRYQHVQEAQFETYAVTRIRGAMLDELRRLDWLPRSARGKARLIEQAMVSLSQRLLRRASEAEIAAELGITQATYRQLLDDACGVQVIHYEDMAFDGSENGMECALAGEFVQSAQRRNNPLNQVISRDLHRAIADAVEALPERERQLLSLLVERELNQNEVAVVMGISEGRVSQLRTQAIVRIRAALAALAQEDGWSHLELKIFCSEVS
ncbi:RNA polymerase sigma factor FliA [Allopusillimonas ginsengisoli]|uniref:RNA polymerase sigma factor FliA n=1 Tax=Allopusillimonas ginsengisoli TaxID=453575 RepID=UPI00101F6EE7|nr:RNA polymerase sigma factor FliA [Allopusillimonas ginsengisoli]TEA79389.1 FliA/WhiG family RNA polymerase sigma factor [Allopusillimonas ginsengisoli]